MHWFYNEESNSLFQALKLWGRGTAKNPVPALRVVLFGFTDFSKIYKNKLPLGMDYGNKETREVCEAFLNNLNFALEQKSMTCFRLWVLFCRKT